MGKMYMESAWELEIKDRLATITPGPWRVGEYIDGRGDKQLHVRQPDGAPEYGVCAIFGEPDGEDAHVRADAAFIAAAPADITMLLKLAAVTA